MLYTIIFNLFIITGALTAASVILVSNPINSLIFLIATFIISGFGLYLIDLQFFAFLFVLIYVGAIAVLFIFVVMCLNINDLSYHNKAENRPLFFLIVVLSTALFTYFDLFYIDQINIVKQTNDIFLNLFFDTNELIVLGQLLYYYFPITTIILSLLLLVAMIGCIKITLSEPHQIRKQQIHIQNSISFKDIIRLL
jgi:NADH-quinone oxidoreductase subunit J